MTDRTRGLTRRQLLVSASVGGLSALAGCNENPPEDTTPGTITGTVEESKPSASGPLSITDQRFVTDQGPTEQSGVEVEIENTGSARLGAVMLSPQFFDRNDDLMAIGRQRVFDLDASETWRTFVPFRGNGRTVKRYQLVAEYTEAAGPWTPNSVAVVSDERVDAGYTARVRGDLRNDGQNLDYVEARAKFYDSAGNLLYRGSEGLADFGAGETWSFEIDFQSDDHDLHDEVNSYELELAERWWWR